MPLQRLWLKANDKFHFVYEADVIIDEDGVGNTVLEEDQLLVLYKLILETIKEARDSDREEDQD